MSEGCGKCFKLTGSSNIPNKEGLKTTIILKGTNYCPPGNPKCENGGIHFDIAAPGFDYLAASLSNHCDEIYPAGEKEAFKMCSMWMIKN
mmetsp:Transcript_4898/g.7338  ORF Transcript_4898/g.7338 Transcript_4898/m.7338 type:complete len:90 (-) Transcript_4898:868-1137(-)